MVLRFWKWRKGKFVGTAITWLKINKLFTFIFRIRSVILRLARQFIAGLRIENNMNVFMDYRRQKNSSNISTNTFVGRGTRDLGINCRANPTILAVTPLHL